MSKYLQRTMESAGKLFVGAYLGSWVGHTADYDHLFTFDNLKAGVVGVALALAYAVGVRNVGSKDSPTVT